MFFFFFLHILHNLQSRINSPNNISDVNTAEGGVAVVFFLSRLSAHGRYTNRRPPPSQKYTLGDETPRAWLSYVSGLVLTGVSAPGPPVSTHYPGPRPPPGDRRYYRFADTRRGGIIIYIVLRRPPAFYRHSVPAPLASAHLPPGYPSKTVNSAALNNAIFRGRARVVSRPRVARIIVIIVVGRWRRCRFGRGARGGEGGGAKTNNRKTSSRR